MSLKKLAIVFGVALVVTGIGAALVIGGNKASRFSRFVIAALIKQGEQIELAERATADAIEATKATIVAGLKREIELTEASITADLKRKIDENAAPVTSIDLVGTAVPISVERADKGSLAPVSMTRVAPDRYLVANYRNIYLFDPVKRTMRPLSIEGLVPIWNPTAVFYSAFHDEVFIANYTGQDILIAKLDDSGDQPRLRLKQRLTHSEGIEGPEGLAVSHGGRYLAVASYEGNATALFEMVDGQWRYRWKQPVASSHGVAIVGEYVYGAGTTIAKFEIESGKEVARITHLGDEVIRFATCLDYDERTGALFGSDTIAGRVFTLDRDLKLTSIFGANGPTAANLSMPYCAYREGKTSYILSTFQERILKIEGDTTISFNMRADYWPYLDASLPQQKLSADAWKNFVKSDHPTVTLFGKEVQPGYGRVTAKDGTNLLLPTRSGALSAKWLHYITTTAKAGPWTLVASMSAPAALLINGATGEMAFAATGEFDCWAAVDDLMCPSRRYSIDDLLALSKRVMPSADPDDIARGMGISVAELLDELVSEGAQKLKEAVAEANPTPAAREYLTWADGKSVPIVEYWIATALAR